MSVARAITCFCPTCVRTMGEQGIDVRALRDALKRLLEDLTGGSAGKVGPNLGELPREVLAWRFFRQTQITRLAEELRYRLRQWGHERSTNVSLILNLWPPSFAPWLGQDYARLGRLCDGAKHFPYHRLGGGADLAGLVDALAAGPDGTHHPSVEERERVFSALLRMLSIAPGVVLSDFRVRGFPVDFVESETAAAKAAFGPTPVYTGVQIWDTPVAEVELAVAAARRAGASGVFFYCYGWATLESLDAVGRIVRSESL